MDILEEMEKFIATYNFLKSGRNRQSEQNLSLLVKLNLQLKIKTPRKKFQTQMASPGNSSKQYRKANIQCSCLENPRDGGA